MSKVFIPPDPEEALADIAPVTDILWRVLEDASAKALDAVFDEIIAREPRRWDAGTHATLTRYFATPMLDAAGVKAAAEAENGEAPFSRLGLANNGICIIHKRYVIRVRKADDGRIPVAGSSAMESFLAQQMSFPRHLMGVTEPEKPNNLVVLWGLEPEQHGFKDLLAACPRESGKEPYWYKFVVHPALRIERKATTTPAPSERADDFDEIVASKANATRVHE